MELPSTKIMQLEAVLWKSWIYTLYKPSIILIKWSMNFNKYSINTLDIGWNIDMSTESEDVYLTPIVVFWEEEGK